MSDHAPSGEEKASLLSNILAIIGLIILVIIVIWGVVHLVDLSSGWFSSLFQRSAPTLQVEAPSDATAGAPITVSWNYTASTPGNYAFLYQCKNGFQFALISTSTNTAQGMPCGAAFAITPTNNAILLLPVLQGSSSVSVPLTITYTTSAGAQVQGSATVTIHPASNQAQAQQQTQPSQTTTSASKPAGSQPSGASAAPVRAAAPADLAVQILAVGVIDPVTGQFINRAPTSPNDTAAVEFNIANIGGTSTGTWYFQATLPTASGYLYTSPAQAPLSPGAHIINTLRFTQVRAGGGSFSVLVNPNDYVRESNYSNDSASVYITMSSYYGNGYNGGYYSTNTANGPTVYYQSQPY